MAGKGDDRRPAAVSDAEFDANWRAIFGSTERRREPATEPATKFRKPRPRPEDIARRIGQLELLPESDCIGKRFGCICDRCLWR